MPEAGDIKESFPRSKQHLGNLFTKRFPDPPKTFNTCPIPGFFERKLGIRQILEVLVKMLGPRETRGYKNGFPDILPTGVTWYHGFLMHILGSTQKSCFIRLCVTM
jgi:hypothetical protein